MKDGLVLNITLDAGSIRAFDPEWGEGRQQEFLPVVLREAGIHLAEKLLESAAERVDAEIRSALQSLLAEKLSPMVDDILHSGIPKTDQYGLQKGTLTVKDMIISMLGRDRYGHGWLDGVVKDWLKKELRNDFQKELSEARAKVKAMVDEETVGRIRDAIRKALGVRL